MKIVRTLGLAVFAATALIAVAGAGTALAMDTTLCKTSTKSPFCASGDGYAAGASIEASSAGTLEIKSDLANVKCGESQLKAETTAADGSPLPLAPSAWTLSKCGTNVNMNNCTSSTTELSESGSLSWSKGSNGTLALGGKGVVWNLHCTSLGVLKMDCTFTASPAASLEGGAPAHIAVPQTTLGNSGGSLCPKTATLQATNYNVTSPSPVYVAVEGPGTQLCKNYWSPCSEADTYPSGTSIETSATDFKIVGPLFNYTCKKASLALKTLSTMGEPLPVSATGASLGECKANGLGGCSVKTYIRTPKTPTGIQWSGGEDGTLKNLTLSWEFICGSAPFAWETTFETDLIEAKVDAVELTTAIKYEGSPSLICKGDCQASSALTATFNVSAPTPLYVTHF